MRGVFRGDETEKTCFVDNIAVASLASSTSSSSLFTRPSLSFSLYKLYSGDKLPVTVERRTVCCVRDDSLMKYSLDLLVEPLSISTHPGPV